MQTTISRRTFIHALLGAGLVAGGGAVAAQALREPHQIRVRRVAAPLPSLPAGLDGLTIAQLSDLHRGPHVAEEHIRRGAEIAASLDPDLVVITGDFVSKSARYATSCAEALRPLRARLGVYAVLGNHDHWTGQTRLIRQVLARRGVEVLVNGSARFSHDSVDWWLCGVDDVWSGGPDLRATLAGARRDAFRVLLCHEPDFADVAADAGVPLQLSGHSHGGQVILPIAGPVVLPPHGRKYPIGLRRVAGRQTLIYTNVGLGLIAPAIRFNCPPEVTLLTLRTA